MNCPLSVPKLKDTVICILTSKSERYEAIYNNEVVPPKEQRYHFMHI